MCNRYKPDARSRQRMGESSETKIRIPQFDFEAPRVNVQGDDVHPGYIGEILLPDDGRLVAAAATGT